VSKPTFLLLLLMLSAVAAPVLADGKFYTYEEEIPPEIPYQRALLMFARGQETLILQSKYQVAGSSAGDLGWVVPVPSVPDLASMEARAARAMFDGLDLISYPKVTRIGSLLLGGLVFLLLVGLPMFFFVGVLSLLVRSCRPTRRQWGLLVGWAILGGLALMYVFLWMLPIGGAAGGIEGVEVIKAEQVGIYDVQVLRSDDATALLDWLDQHQFRFDEADTQAFDEYLRQGWVFVVARIDPSAAQGGEEVVSEGLVAPLILRFQAEAPVYPLALTATTGHPTQILLYLLGEDKWEDDGRLDLHYAGAAPSRAGLLDYEVEPEGFFDDAEGTFPVLCKFKGTLSPEEMREDLTFTLAKDYKPYRKWVVTW
jgi:hypothetical protein